MSAVLRFPRPVGVLAIMGAALVIALLIADPHRAATTPSTAPPSPAATAPAIGTKPFAPTAVSEDKLRHLTSGLGRPVYWAGPVDGQQYEISQLAGGAVVIRYLPSGVAAGATQPLRTITTSTVPNAFLAIRAIAQEQGAVSQPVKGGAIAVYRPSAPNHVFLSVPGDDRQQVEVFAPSTAEAQELATAGAIQAVR